MVSLKITFFFLILIVSPQPSNSFFLFSTSCYSLFTLIFGSISFSSYQTILSLSHSLAKRVANLRTARGDFDGAARVTRACSFAQKIHPGFSLGFWRFVWSIGWDYVRNYLRRDTASTSEAMGIVLDLKELMRVVNELARSKSNKDRVAWLQRNYCNVLGVSKSVFVRLGKVFYQQGPLKEVVKVLQKEVVEGELLKDCLELGSDDLNALIVIFEDLVLQYSAVSATSRKDEL